MFIVFDRLQDNRIKVYDTEDNVLETVYPEALKVASSMGYEVQFSKYTNFASDLRHFYINIANSSDVSEHDIIYLIAIQNKLCEHNIKLVPSNCRSGKRILFSMGDSDIFVIFLYRDDMRCAYMLCIDIDVGGAIKINTLELNEVLDYVSHRAIIARSQVKLYRSSNGDNITLIICIREGVWYRQFIYTFTSRLERMLCEVKLT